jgi:hypothetical protein
MCSQRRSVYDKAENYSVRVNQRTDDKVVLCNATESAVCMRRLVVYCGVKYTLSNRMSGLIGERKCVRNIHSDGISLVCCTALSAFSPIVREASALHCLVMSAT